MKKTIAVLIAVWMLFALSACGAQTTEHAQTSSSGDSVSQSTGSLTSTSETENSDEKEKSTMTQTASEKILVAYFSCTNTTKSLATYVADGLGADLYEITPAEAYTSADIDYNNDNSRSTKEMNDPGSRPAISGSVEHMEQYDIVFVGYPIWWGEAPRILSTFMESYDFSGKTVIPFCTSGSSGIGSSGTNLEKLTNGARWLSGARFSGGTVRSDMISWLNGLELGVTAK